jgi:hypothetical protein
MRQKAFAGFTGRGSMEIPVIDPIKINRDHCDLEHSGLILLK